MSQGIPTLFEWAGGTEALNRLTQTFYGKVFRDPIVGLVFNNMSPDHPAHVAAFIGEVFRGPKTYSEKHGGHREMVMHHLGKHLTEEQRRRWINLLADAADEVGLPDDPEFRSAFMAYVEWGSRLAKMNSTIARPAIPRPSRCRPGAGACPADRTGSRRADDPDSPRRFPT